MGSTVLGSFFFWALLMNVYFVYGSNDQDVTALHLNMDITAFKWPYRIYYRQAVPKGSFECLCSQSQPMCKGYYKNKILMDESEKQSAVMTSLSTKLNCSVVLNDGEKYFQGLSPKVPQCDVVGFERYSVGCHVRMNLYWGDDIDVPAYLMTCLCHAHFKVLPQHGLTPPFHSTTDGDCNVYLGFMDILTLFFFSVSLLISGYLCTLLYYVSTYDLFKIFFRHREKIIGFVKNLIFGDEDKIVQHDKKIGQATTMYKKKHIGVASVSSKVSQRQCDDIDENKNDADNNTNENAEDDSDADENVDDNGDEFVDNVHDNVDDYVKDMPNGQLEHRLQNGGNSHSPSHGSEAPTSSYSDAPNIEPSCSLQHDGDPNCHSSDRRTPPEDDLFQRSSSPHLNGSDTNYTPSDDTFTSRPNDTQTQESICPPVSEGDPNTASADSQIFTPSPTNLSVTEGEEYLKHQE